jgi:hypothetical protein
MTGNGQVVREDPSSQVNYENDPNHRDFIEVLKILGTPVAFVLLNLAVPSFF